MKINLNPNGANTKVELENGEDFIKLLSKNGLGLFAIRFYGVEVNRASSVVFEAKVNLEGSLTVEVPDELCGVKIMKEEQET